MKHLGLKLQGFFQVPEEMFGFGEVGVLEKIDGQLTPNQFLQTVSSSKEIQAS